MTMFGGVLLYLGLISAAAGVASLLKPFRFLGIGTRKRGLVVLGLGLLAFTTGVYLPITETRVENPRTRLDEFAPAFQFNEVHTVSINAPKDRVYLAVWAVCPEEIRFFKTLMWMRGFGDTMAPEHRPILESFTAGWFLPLAEDPSREIVIGRAGSARGGRSLTAEEFKLPFEAPRVKIVMNFHIDDVDATHCTLTTETRVYAVGTHVLRGFATYWRMNYPGSALIRRMWLRAIKLRAEGFRNLRP
jgi:hypothetical protein